MYDLIGFPVYEGSVSWRIFHGIFTTFRVRHA